MWPHGLNQALARLGRRNAAGVARQKPHAKAGLKCTDGATEGRLRHAELRGGTGEVPLPRDGQEGDQVRDGLPRHSCFLVISPSQM